MIRNHYAWVASNQLQAYPLRLVRCAEGIPETVRGLTTDARTSLAVVRIGLVALL